MQVQAPSKVKVASIEHPKPFSWKNDNQEKNNKEDAFENSHQFENRQKNQIVEKHPIKNFFKSIARGFSNLYHAIFSLGTDNRETVKISQLPKLHKHKKWER